MRSAVRSLLLLCLLAGPVAGAEDKPIWLAVGSEELTAPLAPLVEKRKADGYVVRIATPPVADAIRALGRPPTILLLVGDYEPGKDDETWQIPPMRRPLYKWRRPQRAQFSSDSLYGDTDGDLVPDFPVGRIPARTPEQVKLVVTKTLAYERRVPTLDDLRIVAWAGAPGYGGTIDALATGMLVSTVRRYAPAWADRFLISASAGNDLCGWPPDQPKTFNDEWKKGAVLAAFVAHASDEAVYSMRHGEKGVWYHPGIVRKAFATAPPIVAPALFLTCRSGEFDDANECLGETLLFLPGGPPVVIAATTESHPLTNLFTGRALLTEMSKGGLRIGPMWTAAQREARTMRDFIMESMLKDVEGKLEEKIDVAKLRRDQPLMYAILGDPALRLRVPSRFEVELSRTAHAWNFSVPKDRVAGATELVVGWRGGPRGRLRKLPPPPKDAAEANQRLREANRREAFRVVRTYGRDEDWSGVVTQPGTYRFVLRGESVLAVATTKAEKPR